jgi:hypothetical protein
MSTFVNWVVDTLARQDVIDLYFILSNLVDINLTEAEICKTAYYDALASATVHEHIGDSGIPIGKLVL